MKLSERRYRLVEVARSGQRFASFAPYVASIDDRGSIAFAAAFAGGSGIYRVDLGGAVEVISEEGAASHPAHDEGGEVAYYRRGRLIRGRAGALRELDGPEVGPLGPTINRSGAVALRCRIGGVEAIAVERGGEVEVVARAGGELAGFHGLPCAADSGAVCFRADLAGGGQVIRVGAEVWASTGPGSGLAELGRFPAIDDTGLVVFAGTGEQPGIFASRGPGTTTAVIAGGFESYRGALACGGEVAVFYATPAGGALGVYTGSDPEADRLIGLGDDFAGDRVVDLALNPVSINASGQLAIRLVLAGGVELITRADPR